MIVLVGVTGLFSMSFNWQQTDDIFELHYLKAKDNAQANQKSLLLLFVTDNCKKCNAQRKMIEEDLDLVRLIESKYETAVVNIDDFDGKAIRDYYNVNETPGLLLVSNSGQIQWKHDGQVSKGKLISQLEYKTDQRHIEGSTDVTPIPETVIDNSSSGISIIEQKTTHSKEMKAEKLTPNQNLPAFQIQYGFFGSKTNADNVLKKLVESGQSECYILEEARDGKTYFRVLSPLFSGQNDAQMMLHHTKKQGLEGTIKKIQ
jgi:thioredoxin-related protein